MTVVLSIAAAAALLLARLGQPPVLGFLAAGLLIGPHALPTPLVSDIPTMEALAEIGVVFLLFALGVEFNLRRLAGLGLRPLISAGAGALLMATAGRAGGWALGWGPADSWLLGGVSALSSTAIVARGLLEKGRRRGGWEELVSGKLIAEDLIAVLMLALCSSAARLGSPSWAALFGVLARSGALILVIMTVGLLVLPRLLDAAEGARIGEMRSLAIIGICFGTAFLTKRLGYSAALGAFLAGAMVSVSRPSASLQETVTPFREVFGAVFFVSVGMLIDPAWILKEWRIALMLAGASIALRWMVNFTVLGAVGIDPAGAAQAAACLLPIGEFSFILAQLGAQTSLTSKPIYSLAVTLCLATTLAREPLQASATPERVRGLIGGRLWKALEGYREGLARLAAPSRGRLVWNLVRPSAVQIGLNALAISGFFVTVAAAQERYGLKEAWPGLVWMASALICLPFLNALARKTQAVSLILLEAATAGIDEGRPPAEARPRLTKTVMAFAGALVGLWFLALSLLLMPEWADVFLPGSFVALAGVLLWRRSTRFYSGLQATWRSALTRTQAEPEAAATALALFAESLAPKSIHVEVMELPAGAWAAGRTLIEIGLRARTGASLLQVDRAGERLPAPGPHLRLLGGDRLLLIGEPEQLDRGRTLLNGG